MDEEIPRIDIEAANKYDPLVGDDIREDNTSNGGEINGQRDKS